MVGFIKSALNALGINKGKEGATNISLEEFLNEVPRAMGYDVAFKRLESEEKGVHFEVEGEEVDSFVGDSSDMLDALAHISMRVLRRAEGLANAPTEEGQEALRVTFDSQGFRERKKKELEDLAASQRQRVIETGGKPAYIPALGPSERKIIHTFLAELGEVVSESIGRGNFKRIRLRLKEDSPHRRAPEPREAQPTEARAEGGERPQHARGPRGPGGFGGGQGGGGGRRNNRGGQGGGGGNRGGFRGPRSNGGGGRQQQPYGNSGRFGESPNEFGSDSSPVDDNVGNRLLPGEEPIFKYESSATKPFNNDDDFDKN